MPLPVIDSVILSGSLWLSCRLADESRWATGDECRRLQAEYDRQGGIPAGATVMRQSVAPEQGVELLASPMRASMRDPSSPIIRIKRTRDGRVVMRPKRKRKHLPPQS